MDISGMTDCESCGYYANCEGDGVLPCGQQNCWYSCTVCRYNNADNDGESCADCENNKS